MKINTDLEVKGICLNNASCALSVWVTEENGIAQLIRVVVVLRGHDNETIDWQVVEFLPSKLQI